ncbi:MAG: SGNH/GDSL hydrolase family protein [Lachnospiraceae bacterium]|nr:SGNH/GDSL hydrolase family protein [Lachnospiraceae bacterium]
MILYMNAIHRIRYNPAFFLSCCLTVCCLMCGCASDTATPGSAGGAAEAQDARESAGQDAFPMLTRDNFDHVRYAEDYPDLKDAFGYDADALWQHFITLGLREGRLYHSTDPEVEEIITGFDGEKKLALRQALLGESPAEADFEMILPELTDGEVLSSLSIDYEDYLTRYPDVRALCGEDPSLIRAHIWETGLRERREIHMTDPGEEQIIASGDAQAYAQLFQLYRNPYVLGGVSFRADAGEEEAPSASAGDGPVEAAPQRIVCIGDSVMAGFQNVCADSEEALFQSFMFLATHGYSCELALEESGNGYHPMYRGKKVPLWESVPASGADTAFFFLGMMDLSEGRTVEEVADMYAALLDRIKEAAPDLKIVIISLTYVYGGMGRETLNSAKIAALNGMLYELALDNGWGFIDVAYPLSDGEGNLTPEYSQDEQTHIIPAGYEIWKLCIRSYLARQAAENRPR